MTLSPILLVEVGRYWTKQGGVNLGIVGDARHLAAGTSYHCGKDHLKPGAYSAITPRDVAGLSLYASAIDLGRLNGRFTDLRAFSTWLVDQARHNASDTRDMREIIYSPDGVRVLRWDRQRGVASAPRDGEADDSHRSHTHISWYRDSRNRDQIGPFTRYFESHAPPPSTPEDTMGPFVVPEKPQQVLLKEDPNRPGNSVWLYTTSELKPDGREKSLSPEPETVRTFRPLMHIGSLTGIVIVAYEPATLDTNETSVAMYVSSAGVSSLQPYVRAEPDCKAEVAAAIKIDRGKAKIVYS